MSNAIKIQSGQTLLDKILHINWGLVLIICLIASIGFAALYSAGGGNLNPWASRQMVRFAMGCCVMFGVALIDVKWWYKLAWPIYGATFALLVIVEIMGQIGMGAQRWINIAGINLQPSELMKVAVVLVLARYLHAASSYDMRRLIFLVVPALLIFMPVGLVLLQPDLGTSLMIILAGGAMFFIAGAPIYLFLLVGGLAISSLPIAWHFMHEYQKKRVLTFLNPESDPLGSGYHITQSKIALGSGGVEGKGFLNGSQSHLNFLPEKQTDFIFTLWAEEWGLIGGLFLLGLFGLVFFYGAMISSRARSNFSKYLALGLTINFSLYVFINIGMVMGLLPVVGAPLPLISYGGTSMLVTLLAFGLIMSCSIHADSKVSGSS